MSLFPVFNAKDRRSRPSSSSPSTTYDHVAPRYLEHTSASKARKQKILASTNQKRKKSGTPTGGGPRSASLHAAVIASYEAQERRTSPRRRHPSTPPGIQTPSHKTKKKKKKKQTTSPRIERLARSERKTKNVSKASASHHISPPHWRRSSVDGGTAVLDEGKTFDGTNRNARGRHLSRTTKDFIGILRQDPLTYKERLAFTAKNIHEHDGSVVMNEREMENVRHKIRKHAYDLGGVNLRKVFRRSMDANHDGRLSYDEFVHSVRRMVTLNDDQIVALLRVVDKNRNGYVDFEELEDFVFRRSEEEIEARRGRTKRREADGDTEQSLKEKLEDAISEIRKLSDEVERWKASSEENKRVMLDLRADHDACLETLGEHETALERERAKTGELADALTSAEDRAARELGKERSRFEREIEALQAKLAVADRSNDASEETGRMRAEIRDLSRKLEAATMSDETDRLRETITRLEADVQVWRGRALAAEADAKTMRETLTRNASAEPRATEKDDDDRVETLTRDLESARRTIERLRSTPTRASSAPKTTTTTTTPTTTSVIPRAADTSKSDSSSQKATLWMGSRMSRYGRYGKPSALEEGNASALLTSKTSSNAAGDNIFIGDPLWRKLKWWPVEKRSVEAYERVLGIPSKKENA